LWNDSDAFNEKCLGAGVKKGGYHLQLLGVHPDYQKKGICSAFDKAMCDVVRSLYGKLGAARIDMKI